MASLLRLRSLPNCAFNALHCSTIVPFLVMLVSRIVRMEGAEYPSERKYMKYRIHIKYTLLYIERSNLI
jgi:hypothetical protein